ncbi:MAG: metal ABC transporter solute-binding protein, Zn/Mn family, partial [Alphaproteobacteria bacterium]
MNKIFKTIFFSLLVGSWSAFAGPALADLSVFACEPEWGALSREVGGDKVKVRDATSPLQDPHFVTARPSLIAAVRKADIVVCNGADLEIGWLPLLLRQSANKDVQPSARGNFAAADFVEKLEVPTSVDRALGDIHPQGNPHIIGNPHNITIVAEALSQRFAQIDPENAAFYSANYQAFADRWRAAIIRWEAAAAPLRGLPVVVQHKTWVYLVAWLGLRVVTTLEPRPGIPPTTSHLQGVLNRIQGNPPKLILNG